jgi:hypothetical protein
MEAQWPMMRQRERTPGIRKRKLCSDGKKPPTITERKEASSYPVNIYRYPNEIPGEVSLVHCAEGLRDEGCMDVVQGIGNETKNIDLVKSPGPREADAACGVHPATKHNGF